MAWKVKIRIGETVVHEEDHGTEESARGRIEEIKSGSTLIGLAGEWVSCGCCEWTQGIMHLGIEEV